MQKFTIAWDASLGGSFEVEANSSEEAIANVKKRIQEGEITLDDLTVFEERVFDIEEGAGND